MYRNVLNSLVFTLTIFTIVTARYLFSKEGRACEEQDEGKRHVQAYACFPWLMRGMPVIPYFFGLAFAYHSVCDCITGTGAARAISAAAAAAGIAVSFLSLRLHRFVKGWQIEVSDGRVCVRGMSDAEVVTGLEETTAKKNGLGTIGLYSSGKRIASVCPFCEGYDSVRKLFNV